MLRLFNNSIFIQQLHIYSIIFIQYPYLYSFNNQKQPPRGVPRKRCSENMQQIYKRTPMPKCDFIKVARKRCSENMQQIYRRTFMPKCDFNFIEIALRHGCSPVNLLHIFKTPFPRNTSCWLLLNNLTFIQ